MAATSDALQAAPADDAEWRPARGKTGMACLIAMESFFFGTFIVAFLYYVGKDVRARPARTASRWDR